MHQVESQPGLYYDAQSTNHQDALENVCRMRDDGDICAGQLVHHIIVRISRQIRTVITSCTAFPFLYVTGCTCTHAHSTVTECTSVSHALFISVFFPLECR
jgi:hypothetical protein